MVLHKTDPKKALAQQIVKQFDSIASKNKAIDAQEPIALMPDILKAVETGEIRVESSSS